MDRKIIRAWAIWTSGSGTSSAGHTFNTTWRIELSCGHWLTYQGLLIAMWMRCPECAQQTRQD